MKLLYSIILFTFSFYFSSNIQGYSQIKPNKNDSIFIGKRGNLVWDKKIQEINLGNTWFTYYYPIYFKRNRNDEFQRIGFLGNKLKDDLNSLPASKREFKKYRIKKSLSFFALPVAASSLLIWTNIGIDEVIIGHPRPFLSNKSLPFLGTYLICFTGGIYLNTKADINLLISVRNYNSNIPLTK
jgi:hypothetical protein